MVTLKTFLVAGAIAATPFSNAGATEHKRIDPIVRTFAGCVGRLSATMEHQWLLSDPTADRTEAQRTAMLSLLNAVSDIDTGRTILAIRVATKQAHARLLFLSTFSQPPDGQRRAYYEKRAEQEISVCLGLLLG